MYEKGIRRILQRLSIPSILFTEARSLKGARKVLSVSLYAMWISQEEYEDAMFDLNWLQIERRHAACL